MYILYFLYILVFASICLYTSYRTYLLVKIGIRQNVRIVCICLYKSVYGTNSLPFFLFVRIGPYCLYTFVYACKFVRSFIVRCQCIYLQNLYIEQYTNIFDIEIHMYITIYTSNIQTHTNNIRLSPLPKPVRRPDCIRT